MSAIFFSWLLISYWLLFGFGLFAITRCHTNFHLRLFISPALGLAFNLVILFVFSRFGFPIKDVALPVFVGGTFTIIYFIYKQKTIWQRYIFGIFCIILLSGIIPFVWPLFKFGFEWLAFVNGDFSYYSLSSTRFLNYGYSELPTSGNIFDDSDHSLAYWFFPNVIGHRSGADILLAQLVGLTHLTAHQVYMPFIIACHIIVGASTAALTLISCRNLSAAIFSMVLVIISPMLTLEVTKQLLAQAIGLVFLVSLTATYIKVSSETKFSSWSGIVVILFSGLAIAYSELLSFFGIFVLFHEIVGWKKWLKKNECKKYIKNCIYILLGILIILNSYLIDAGKFIILAMGGSFKSAAMTIKGNGLSLFPHFFLPHSGALLLGWLPFGGPGNIFLVVLGLIFTLLFVFIAIYCFARSGAAKMSMIMLLLAVSMFSKENGFGLFKIAMFIQPFMIATLIIFTTLHVSKAILRQTGFFLFGISIIPAQLQNINKVVEDIGDARVPFASSAQLGKQFRALSDDARAMNINEIYSDTTIRELFLLQSYYFKGILFSSLALPTWGEFLAEKFSSTLNKNEIIPSSGVQIEKEQFNFDPLSNSKNAQFNSVKHYTKNQTILTSGRDFSIINRFNQPPERKFLFRPAIELKDFLIFKGTSLGSSHIGKGFTEGTVALWGIEADPFFIDQTMACIGRYHLYMVLGATPQSRMMLSITTTTHQQDDYLLPPVKVVGKEISQFPIVGRGSARIISQPIAPQKIADAEYLGLDLGRDGFYLGQERTGIMGWFGKEIKLDVRKSVAFARDISYITSEQYLAFERPKALHDFPTALEDPNLEYSGFFEDGWISNAAYVILNAPKKNVNRTLNIFAVIPDIGGSPFNTIITIKINEQIVYREMHLKGDVKISIPINDLFIQTETVKIQIESSALQRLPNGDNRPVSLRLDYLGFKD